MLLLTFCCLLAFQVRQYALWYNPGTIDNYFSSATESAVKAFQRDYGLTADGIVGSGTYSKLKVAHRFGNEYGGWRYLSYGKKGDDVAQLQFRLVKRGYLAGLYEVDGLFGFKTKSAVINFQKSKGIGADGIVGPNTYYQLMYK